MNMKESKEIKILRKFIYWCIAGLFICFIGMSNVFGAEYYFDYSYTQNYYNNNGASGNDIGSNWNESLQAYVSNNIYTIANSYGGGVVFNSPIPLLANHTYTMSLSFLNKNNIALSSKNHISISNNPSGTASVYFNNNFGVDMLYSNVSNNSILSFAFKANRNDTYIFVPFTTTTTTTQSYVMTSVVIDDLGSEGISQQDINNSINSQTNVLNNSIQASTNTITGALQDTQDSLSQDIQDMGENITGAINDNFNSCRDSYNLIDFKSYLINPTSGLSNVYNSNNDEINLTGTLSNNYVNITSTININLSADKYYFISKNSLNKTIKLRITYDDNTLKYVNLTSSNKSIPFTLDKNAIKIAMYMDNLTVGEVINLSSNFMLSKDNVSYEKYGEVCKNKIDETNDKLDEAEETRKGILATLLDIPRLIGEKIKELFIPDSEDLEEIIEEFKEWAELKFGILYDSIDLVVQFITNFNDITEGNDVIIHIPDITVPNFEDNIIIEEQDFNWTELLESKESLNTLWEIYLSFIDVFIIIAFLNLCENIFSGITGEPTEPTDQIYESEGESYDVNDNTGEVTNHKVWRKESRRKK